MMLWTRGRKQQGTSTFASSLLCTSGNCLPHARRVERVQRAVGKNSSITSELPCIYSTKPGVNHISHNALPQCRLTAVGAPSSAVIWRNDPVYTPGGDRPDLMDTCKATWPRPLTWCSSGRSGFRSDSLSCFGSTCLASTE